LLSTENDDYEDCTRDVMRKCIIEGFTQFQEHAARNFMAAFKKYRTCFEKEAKICDAAIMKHFLANTKAEKKLLEEDGQGEFGKCLKEF